MADTSGEADIRGIDIDKLAKGFADIQNTFKSFVTISKTKAREIRWYQKTSGFLDTPTTDDTAGTLMANVPFGAQPFEIEQSWTRQVSHVRKFFVASPPIAIEDIKDSDIDVLATNVRDIVRAVERKVDLRIFAIMSDALEATPTEPLTNGAITVQHTAATGTGWDDTTNGDPIKDILNGQKLMRQQGYNPLGSILGLNSVEHQNLITYLINVKGSSIPGYSSEQVKSGVVMGLLDHKVKVSENFTTDWVYQIIPQRALTWKAFMPITSKVIDNPGISKTIRCWEEGECLLTDPKAIHIISDTVT